MFLLFPKKVRSDWPIAGAYDDSLVGSLASARGCEMATNIEWSGLPRMSATEELNAQTCWRGKDSTFLETKDRGAVAVVLDLAESFERVSLPVVWAWATHQRRVEFITAILPGSKCVVLQDALSEVTQLCPPLKLCVFVDDTTS